MPSALPLPVLQLLVEVGQARFLAECCPLLERLDEHARRKARQRDKPPGLAFDDADLNIQVWAYEWTEVIANALARLQFINSSLNYEANRESARAYLQTAHSKFVPVVGAGDAGEEADEESVAEESTSDGDDSPATTARVRKKPRIDRG